MRKSNFFAIALLIFSTLISCKNAGSYNPASRGGDFDGDISLKIENIQLQIDGLRDNKWEIALGANYSFDKYVELTPIGASLKNVEFSTSDESIAYFDENYNLFSVNEGEFDIILTSKNSKKDKIETRQKVLVRDKSISFSSDYCFFIAALNRWNGIVEYSFDKKHWYEWFGECIKVKRSYNEKYCVYLRGKGNNSGTNGSKIQITSASGEVDYNDLRVRCDGDLAYIVDYNFILPVINNHIVSNDQFCFENLFESCHPLTSSPDMRSFQNCRVKADMMFSGCKNLVEIPDLSGIGLTQDWYHNSESGSSGDPADSDDSGSSGDPADSDDSGSPGGPAPVDPSESSSIFTGCALIKFSQAQDDEYKYEYKFADYVSLNGTGGAFTDVALPNVTYYTSNKIVGYEDN